MGGRLTPKAEQQYLIDRAVSEPTRAALMAPDTGWGKTLVAVEIAKGINARTILIIAPLNTKDGWKATFTRQGVDLPFAQITSSAAGKRTYAALLAGEPGVYFIGHSMFGLSATSKDPDPETGKGGRSAWTNWTKVSKHLDLAILDESHKGTVNRKNVTLTALKTLKPGFKLAMSATPAGNQFAGIWPVCRWLWPDAKNADGNLIVDNSFWRWAATWAEMEFNPHSSLGKKVAGEKVPGAFVATLPCYVRRESPRKPVDTLTAEIPLSPAQLTLYNDMEQKALMWLAEQPYVAELPITQWTRLRQIALGEVTFNDVGEIDFADDCASNKIDACHKIIARHPGESIMFYTSSKRFARVLAKRLGQDAELWTGDVSTASRDDIKARFMARETRYIVATIQSIGEGVDGLQTVCSTEVWLDRADGVKNHQCEGRINRQGQPADRITRYVLHSSPSDDANLAQKLELRATQMRASLSTAAPTGA